MRNISRLFSFVIIASFLVLLQPAKSEAQSLQPLFGNTALGAVNGATLGGATMLLANSSDIRPLTFGIGAGTLAGLGVGAYDMYQLSPGMQVNGLFNRAPLTGGILLLDTFYGAGAGALVGMAISLMGDTRVVYGLQYGAGAGAWAGFAFGLIDAFYFSYHGGSSDFNYEQFGQLPGNSYQPAQGLFRISEQENHSLAILNPVVVSEAVYSDAGRLNYDTGLALEVVRWHVRL